VSIALPTTSLPCAFRAWPDDMNFDADDGLDHGIDELPGAVAHFPRLWLNRFVGSRQAAHNASHHSFVVVDDDATVRVGNHVVPGRNLVMKLLLAGIPVWRDVSVASPKHHQDIIAIGNVPPNRSMTSRRPLRRERPAAGGREKPVLRPTSPAIAARVA